MTLTLTMTMTMRCKTALLDTPIDDVIDTVVVGVGPAKKPG